MTGPIQITDKQSGIRIDKILSDILPEYSRSYIQKCINEGLLKVNGLPSKPNRKVKEGDILELKDITPVRPDILPENIPLDILYEDDDLLIVNKPKGMPVHPSYGHLSGTLVNALMYHCGSNLSGINGVLRPGIVHRIDMDTTGSVIVCKNDFTHNHIANQLKEHTITRVYHAIVHGVINEDEGTIDAPIGRHPSNRKLMAVNRINGKMAVTHYKVLERFSGYTYLKCTLETGRTHQIRVHMASIRHPLLGDTVYGAPKSRFTLHGQTLHAKTIGFVHPRTGEYLETDAPLPEYFLELLKEL